MQSPREPTAPALKRCHPILQLTCDYLGARAQVRHLAAPRQQHPLGQALQNLPQRHLRCFHTARLLSPEERKCQAAHVRPERERFGQLEAAAAAVGMPHPENSWPTVAAMPLLRSCSTRTQEVPPSPETSRCLTPSSTKRRATSGEIPQPVSLTRSRSSKTRTRSDTTAYP